MLISKSLSSEIIYLNIQMKLRQLLLNVTLYNRVTLYVYFLGV